MDENITSGIPFYNAKNNRVLYYNKMINTKVELEKAVVTFDDENSFYQVRIQNKIW